MRRRSQHLAFRLLILGIAVLLTLGGCDLLFGPGDDGDATGYTVEVTEDEGGTFEHPDGFVVHVSPGALSQDTRMTISRREIDLDEDIPTDGTVPLTSFFTVDIGNAVAIGEVTVELPYPVGDRQFDPEYMLISHGDKDGDTWVRPVGRVDTGKGTIVSTNIADQLNNDSREVYTFAIIYIPPLTLLEPTPVLQVPYYWQDFLPWCVPTSLAMVLNYHDGGLAGIVSNWFLAGNHTQDRNSGAWGNEVIRSNGAADSFFDYLKWDADLIPNNAFTAYVKRQTQGYNLQDIYGPTVNIGPLVWNVPDVDIPPRPVQLSSTSTWHAFTAVGTSDERIWLHDSSGAFAGSAGIAIEQDWATFRNIAIVQTETEELHTLVVRHAVRPEAERRGSIELSEGAGSGYVRVISDSYGTISEWWWDGDPYGNGYYWTDRAGAPTLTNDSVYGHAMPSNLVDALEYQVRVGNVTRVEREYYLRVSLRNSFDTEVAGTAYEPIVAAYTRGASITGTIATTQLPPGEYTLRFYLSQDGTLNDIKSVDLRLE